MTAPDQTHVRQTVTPQERSLLVACSCGGIYTVPQDGFSARLREVLDAGHARHIKEAQP